MTDDLHMRRAVETDDGQPAALADDTWSPQTVAGPLPDAAEAFFGSHTGVTCHRLLIGSPS